MKELSVGDSVSIGGKNYTIGSTAADAQKIVTGQEKAGGKVTVNGVEYTYNDTDKKWKDAAGGDILQRQTSAGVIFYTVKQSARNSTQEH